MPEHDTVVAVETALADEDAAGLAAAAGAWLGAAAAGLAVAGADGFAAGWLGDALACGLDAPLAFCLGES